MAPSTRYRLFTNATLRLALLAACGSPEVEPPSRAPGGVGDKPIILTPRGPAIADEIVMRIVGGAAAAARALAEDVGGEVVWRGPRTGAYLVRFADRDAAQAALEVLTARPGVLDVAPALVASGTG